MWHAYEISPIDFGWEHLKTVAQTASELASRDAKLTVKYGDVNAAPPPSAEDFLASWRSAQDAAGAEGWAGDFRDEPVVFWIPMEAEFGFGFVIKQDNNGTTYVVSPVPLPNIAALAE